MQLIHSEHGYLPRLSTITAIVTKKNKLASARVGED